METAAVEYSRCLSENSSLSCVDELFDIYDCEKEEFLSPLSCVQADVMRFSGFDNAGTTLFVDQIKACATCLKTVESARCLSVVLATVEQLEIFDFQMEQLPENTNVVEVLLDARHTGQQFDTQRFLAELCQIETVKKSRKIPLTSVVPQLYSVRGAGDVTQFVEQLIQVQKL